MTLKRNFIIKITNKVILSKIYRVPKQKIMRRQRNWHLLSQLVRRGRVRKVQKNKFREKVIWNQTINFYGPFKNLLGL